MKPTCVDTVSLAAHQDLRVPSGPPCNNRRRLAAALAAHAVLAAHRHSRRNGRPAVLFELDSRRFYIFDSSSTRRTSSTSHRAAAALGLLAVSSSPRWPGGCAATLTRRRSAPRIAMAVGRRLRATGLAHETNAAPWSAAKLLRRGRQTGRVDRHRAVDGLQLRRLLHAIRELGAAARLDWRTVLFYAASPPGATPASCRAGASTAFRALPGLDVRPRHADHRLRHERGEPPGAKAAQERSGGGGGRDAACYQAGACIQVCRPAYLASIKDAVRLSAAPYASTCDAMMWPRSANTPARCYDTLNGVNGASRRRGACAVLRNRACLVYGDGAAGVAMVAASVAAALALQGQPVVRDRSTLARIVDDG